MVEELDQQTIESARVADRSFQALDPRVIQLWRVTDSIACGILLLALLVSVGFTWLAGKYFWPSLAAWFAIAAMCAWYCVWRPPLVYRAWGYRIDEKVLEVRSGRLFQRTRLLPLSRMQHVDIERGPFERGYGLASLVLHTAGTHSSKITIPGLDAERAVRLRDHLVEIGGDDAV
jgi:hypothetical protein